MTRIDENSLAHHPHCPAEVVAQWLRDSSVENLVDPTIWNDQNHNDDHWPVYVGFLPDGEGVPSYALAIYDTPGLSDGRDHLTGQNHEHPGLQIRARGPHPRLVYDQLSRVCVMLDGILHRDVSLDTDDLSYCYVIESANRASTIAGLGQDAQKKWTSYVVNYIVTLTRTK